jgi:hypothetical protein
MPNKYKVLLDIYEEGQLPPDEQIKLAQFLIDTGIYDQLHGTQIQKLCDYFIWEGLCYDVGVVD